MAIVLNGSTGISTPNMTFGDNDKATFGASADLQIYHDGTNSIISDTGTGDLFLKASNNHFIQFNNSDYAIITSENAGVSLRYDNSTRFATTSTGAAVTGTVTATSYTEAVFAITGSTPALDPSNGSIQTWQLTAGALNPTDSFSSGESMTVMISNSFLAALVWPAAIEWAGGSAPQFGSSLNAIVLWKVGSTLYGSYIGAMS